MEEKRSGEKGVRKQGIALTAHCPQLNYSFRKLPSKKRQRNDRLSAAPPTFSLATVPFFGSTTSSGGGWWPEPCAGISDVLTWTMTRSSSSSADCARPASLSRRVVCSPLESSGTRAEWSAEWSGGMRKTGREQGNDERTQLEARGEASGVLAPGEERNGSGMVSGTSSGRQRDHGQRIGEHWAADRRVFGVLLLPGVLGPGKQRNGQRITGGMRSTRASGGNAFRRRIAEQSGGMRRPKLAPERRVDEHFA